MVAPPSRRARAAAVVVATVVALAAVGVWSAGAQVDCLVDCTTTTTTSSTTTTTKASTTTTTVPPGESEDDDHATTTTTTSPGSILPDPGTSTTKPPSQDGRQPAPDGDQPLPPLPTPGGDGVPPEEGVGPFPPELRALMDSVKRSGSNNTRALLEALSPLVTDHGLTEQQAAIVGFGRFPIAGYASYSHDWWFPRFGPGWRLHEGTDVFAEMGTPVRAPVDGVVRITTSPLGGLSVYVIEPDGTYWYLAHLAGIPDGITEGVAVTTGQVVGFVGDSGNARGGKPHLHFEIHPGGGPAVDPKPVLDQFIDDALAVAPQVVEAYAAAGGGAGAVAPIVPSPRAPDLAAAASPRTALLWASSVSPTGAALSLAEAEAVDAAASVDWDHRAVADLADAGRRWEVEVRVRAWLEPLTPRRLAAVITTG